MSVLGSDRHNHDSTLRRPQDPGHERQARRVQGTIGLGPVHCRTRSSGFLQRLRSGFRQAGPAHHPDLHLLGAAPAQSRHGPALQELTLRIISLFCSSTNKHLDGC